MPIVIRLNIDVVRSTLRDYYACTNIAINWWRQLPKIAVARNNAGLRKNIGSQTRHAAEAQIINITIGE